MDLHTDYCHLIVDAFTALGSFIMYQRSSVQVYLVFVTYTSLRLLAFITLAAWSWWRKSRNLECLGSSIPNQRQGLRQLTYVLLLFILDFYPSAILYQLVTLVNVAATILHMAQESRFNTVCFFLLFWCSANLVHSCCNGDGRLMFSETLQCPLLVYELSKVQVASFQVCVTDLVLQCDHEEDVDECSRCTCCICLDSMYQQEVIQLKNCEHVYHLECFQELLQSNFVRLHKNQMSCPQCRALIAVSRV